MKAVADTLGVSRSNLIERLKGRSKPRGSYHKAEDAELLPIIRRLVDQRPTYGYRRIAALLNRERRAADKPVVNAKRVRRIMGNHALGGRPNAQNLLRHPALIEPIGCSNVRFEDFSTDYRLMWSIHPTYCTNVFIKNLTIRSTGGNGRIRLARAATRD